MARPLNRLPLGTAIVLGGVTGGHAGVCGVELSCLARGPAVIVLGKVKVVASGAVLLTVSGAKLVLVVTDAGSSSRSGLPGSRQKEIVQPWLGVPDTATSPLSTG